MSSLVWSSSYCLQSYGCNFFSKAFQKGRLLSSCYSILETIINHMTAGPSLQLDDRQVMQLHSAMVGAFSAVLHFLKRVSDDNKIQVGTVHVVDHIYLFIEQDF